MATTKTDALETLRDLHEQHREKNTTWNNPAGEREWERRLEQAEEDALEAGATRDEVAGAAMP